MDDWFSKIDQSSALRERDLEELDELGFIVIPGPVSPDRYPNFAEAYDCAVLNADPNDVAVGSSTTRVNDFVNRGPEFDPLYTYGPILAACCRTIRQPFKLSTMHARTVRPHVKEQDLHIDFSSDSDGWQMIGFILMVDEFGTDNGATRFVPGSHKIADLPLEISRDEVLACGPAGSIIIYNGSVWHGHCANLTDNPRRSIQGSFIRRGAKQAVNYSICMHPNTLGRLGEVARYLLAV